MDVRIKSKCFYQLFFCKKLISFSLIISILPAYASTTDPENFRYFVDPVSGFYFQYPAHWITKPPRGNPDVKIKVSSNADDKANCYVAVTDSSDKTSEISNIEQILQEIRHRYPDTKLIKTGSLILDHFSADFVHVTMAFDNFNSPVSIHNIITIVEKNELTYSITCGSFSSGFEKVEPVFWNIIQSFGLLD